MKVVGSILLIAITTSGCPDKADVRATWRFTDGGAPLSAADGCGRLAATNFYLVEGLPQTVVSLWHWPCTDGEGLVFGEDVGPWWYTSFLSDGNRPISGTASQLTGPTLVEGINELEPMIYDVGQLAGGVRLRVFVDYAGAGGSNCAPFDRGGNGVAVQELRLSNPAGQVCVAVAGTDQLGDGFSTDTCGEQESCKELDVAQALRVPAGTYQLEVRGLKRIASGELLQCYRYQGPLDAQADGDVTIMAPFDGTGHETDCFSP